MTEAISQAPAVRRLMEGPAQSGMALGHDHIDFAGYVVSITRPGRPRMPNGIECDLELRRGEPVLAGRGHLRARGIKVSVGLEWNPRPGRVGVAVEPPAPTPDVAGLAGRGPGLTPEGDDLLAGFAAGLALLHGRTRDAVELAEAAAARTNSLSATLLRHAARGELPEAAHAYLERGSETELLAWGHSSGRLLLHGLQLAGARSAVRQARR